MRWSAALPEATDELLKRMVIIRTGQPCVNAGPRIVSRVSSRILTERPNEEFIRVRRAKKDVRIVSIKAAFRLEDGDMSVNRVRKFVCQFRELGIREIQRVAK